MPYHNAREMIDVVSIMYIKAQNLARELNSKEFKDEDIKRALEDIKEHAKQIVSG
jgi:hypothetical protein